jgi:hypothetical protein
MTIPWLETVLGFALGLAFYFVVRVACDIWYQRRHPPKPAPVTVQDTLNKNYWIDHVSTRKEK